MSQIRLRASRAARIGYALGSRAAKIVIAAVLAAALAGGVVWQWQPIWAWILDTTGLESTQTVRAREARILAHTELKELAARTQDIPEPEYSSEGVTAAWERLTTQLEIAQKLLGDEASRTYELRFANIRLRRALKQYEAALVAHRQAETEAAQRAKEEAEAALAAAEAAAANSGGGSSGGDWSDSSGGGDWSGGGGSSGGGGGGSYAVESTAYSTIECAIYPTQVTITAYASGTVTLHAGGSSNSGSGSTSLTITAHGPVSASATGVAPSLGWGLC